MSYGIPFAPPACLRPHLCQRSVAFRDTTIPEHCTGYARMIYSESYDLGGRRPGAACWPARRCWVCWPGGAARLGRWHWRAALRVAAWGSDRQYRSLGGAGLGLALGAGEAARRAAPLGERLGLLAAGALALGLATWIGVATVIAFGRAASGAQPTDADDARR